MKSKTQIDTNEPVAFPCPIIVDTREQSPFTFASFRADFGQQYRPITVQTIRACLTSGDYSLLGHEAAIAIERKSLEDLFGTLGKGRRRFERELERLSAYRFAAVVCEADWDTISISPPEFSQLKPKVVFRSVIAWQLRYPNVHWWMCPGRRFAEAATFRLLERYWKINNRNLNR